MSEGVTFHLTQGGRDTRVLAYLPSGISLNDAAKINKALAKAYPKATASTAALPEGMAIAILRA